MNQLIPILQELEVERNSVVRSIYNKIIELYDHVDDSRSIQNNIDICFKLLKPLIPPKYYKIWDNISQRNFTNRIYYSDEYMTSINTDDYPVYLEDEDYIKEIQEAYKEVVDNDSWGDYGIDVMLLMGNYIHWKFKL